MSCGHFIRFIYQNQLILYLSEKYLIIIAENAIIQTMKTYFQKLKEFYGSHKAAAAAIGASYRRYNEWRADPDGMPDRAKKLVEFAVLALPIVKKRAAA